MEETVRDIGEDAWTRLFSKVDASGDCWEWTAARDRNGYGRFRLGQRLFGAHRLVYEVLVQTIPSGLEIDHRCRNHACVNPDHLEPVTKAVNLLRGFSGPARNARRTSCPRGHSYDAENTQMRSNGRRRCRACSSEPRTRRARARA